MKYLKIFLGIIGVLTLAYIAIGFIVPSVSYESSVIVNKSAKEAWAVMGDDSKSGEWIPGFVKSELISGTPLTAGAVSNIHFYEGGQEMILQETVTKVIPDKFLAMTFSMDMMDMDYEMIMEENGNQTTLTSKTITSGNGILFKPMIALMKGSMKTQEDKNMILLKNVIDNNVTNYIEAETALVKEELEN